MEIPQENQQNGDPMEKIWEYIESYLNHVQSNSKQYLEIFEEHNSNKNIMEVIKEKSKDRPWSLYSFFLVMSTIEPNNKDIQELTQLLSQNDHSDLNKKFLNKVSKKSSVTSILKKESFMSTLKNSKNIYIAIGSFLAILIIITIVYFYRSRSISSTFGKVVSLSSSESIVSKSSLKDVMDDVGSIVSS